MAWRSAENVVAHDGDPGGDLATELQRLGIDPVVVACHLYLIQVLRSGRHYGPNARAIEAMRARTR